MPTDHRQALSDAIQNCYRVFSKYEAPATWHASPERKPKELLAALTKAPLRELTDDPLGKYAFWAMTTVGDPEHYKYFLPRILELATISSPAHLGLEGHIIAAKIEMAGWRKWPHDEVRAVERCFRAGLSLFLADPDLHHDADGWFEGMEKLGIVSDAI